MLGDAPNDNDHAREFLKLEYTALRGELIKRVELRQRLLEITLVSAAAILTINVTGAEFSRALLAYPILVMFLAFAWVHHDLRLQRIASYVKTRIEPAFDRQSNGATDPVGYETWLDQHPYPNEGRIGGMSSIALFIGSQILVFLLGWTGAWAKTRPQAIDLVLMFVGVQAIYWTAVFLLFYRRLPGPNQWAAAARGFRRDQTHP